MSPYKTKENIDSKLDDFEARLWHIKEKGDQSHKQRKYFLSLCLWCKASRRLDLDLN